MSSVKFYAASLIYQNVMILPTSWTASTTYADYPYEVTIMLDGVTEEYIPEVSFAPIDAMNYMFAPNAITQDGGVTIYAANQPESLVVIPSILCVSGLVGTGGDVDSVLENNSWDTISQVAATGYASAIWSVGDTKTITLNGTVGTLSMSNYNTYVYIIGFNHNGTINTIDFGTFKMFEPSSNYDGTDMALVDGLSSKTDGTLAFNINHWGRGTYGGWIGCDLRYDILGSTDIAPSGYGSIVTSDRIGYDASETCATNPMANTLMAALPFELRTVMKPMIIYTNNKGGTTTSLSYVTASVDYLPLLSEYEIFGTKTNASEYEQYCQDQYSYYIIGNSKIKCKHTSKYSNTIWTTRSAVQHSKDNFCSVSTSGNTTYNYCDSSYGIAPIFRIGNANEFYFTINGIKYKCKYDMTWNEWVESDANNIGVYIESTLVYISPEKNINLGNVITCLGSNKIIPGARYYTD